MESAVVAALVVSDLFVSSDCKLNLSIWGILILNSKSDQEVKLEEALVINEHNSLTLQVRKLRHVEVKSFLKFTPLVAQLRLDPSFPTSQCSFS